MSRNQTKHWFHFEISKALIQNTKSHGVCFTKQSQHCACQTFWQHKNEKWQNNFYIQYTNKMLSDCQHTVHLAHNLIKTNFKLVIATGVKTHQDQNWNEEKHCWVHEKYSLHKLTNKMMEVDNSFHLWRMYKSTTITLKTNMFALNVPIWRP